MLCRFEKGGWGLVRDYEDFCQTVRFFKNKSCIHVSRADAKGLKIGIYIMEMLK